MPIDATQPYDDNNIFARILRGELPCSKVYEDEHALAFNDISPQAPTHVLVIPREHHRTLGDLAGADPEALGELVREAAAVAASDGVAERGYRVVFNTGADAGQSVAHVHAHVLGGRRLGWPPG